MVYDMPYGFIAGKNRENKKITGIYGISKIALINQIKRLFFYQRNDK